MKKIIYIFLLLFTMNRCEPFAIRYCSPLASDIIVAHYDRAQGGSKAFVITNNTFVGEVEHTKNAFMEQKDSYWVEIFHPLAQEGCFFKINQRDAVIITLEYDVPTDQAALVVWIDDHCDTGHGYIYTQQHYAHLRKIAHSASYTYSDFLFNHASDYGQSLLKRAQTFSSKWFDASGACSAFEKLVIALGIHH